MRRPAELHPRVLGSVPVLTDYLERHRIAAARQTRRQEEMNKPHPHRARRIDGPGRLRRPAHAVLHRWPAPEPVTRRPPWHPPRRSYLDSRPWLPERLARPQMVVRQQSDAGAQVEVLERACRWASSSRRTCATPSPAAWPAASALFRRDQGGRQNNVPIWRIAVQVRQFDTTEGQRVDGAFGWTLRRSDATLPPPAARAQRRRWAAASMRSRRARAAWSRTRRRPSRAA